jgi:hypothetical protein
MMRKHHHKPSPKPHMLIVRTLANTDMEITERACINAFTHGVAKSMHFDLLVRIMNLLLVAGNSAKHRQHAYDFAENKLKPVLQSIRTRFEYSGKFGISGTELQTLKQMVEFNREFWKLQPSELFLEATQQVDAFYAELGKK